MRATAIIRRVGVATTLAGVATALAAVAPVAADTGTDHDVTYLGFLRDHGVSINAPGALKRTALGICQGLNDGKTFLQLGGSLMDSGATPHQATVEIFGAVDAYCPGNNRTLQDQTLRLANPPSQLL